MKRSILGAIAAATIMAAPAAMAAPPNPAFNGTVSEIFVNNASVLLVVNSPVRGNCGGSFGRYNLTFDMRDPGARMKFDLIVKAMERGYRIAGYVQGCGSSNINKLSQVAIFR